MSFKISLEILWIKMLKRQSAQFMTHPPPVQERLPTHRAGSGGQACVRGLCSMGRIVHMRARSRLGLALPSLGQRDHSEDSLSH